MDRESVLSIGLRQTYVRYIHHSQPMSLLQWLMVVKSCYHFIALYKNIQTFFVTPPPYKSKLIKPDFSLYVNVHSHIFDVVYKIYI